jgi:hypothetical protein
VKSNVVDQGARGRNGLVDLEVLLAVKKFGGVEVGDKLAHVHRAGRDL